MTYNLQHLGTCVRVRRGCLRRGRTRGVEEARQEQGDPEEKAGAGEDKERTEDDVRDGAAPGGDGAEEADRLGPARRRAAHGEKYNGRREKAPHRDEAAEETPEEKEIEGLQQRVPQKEPHETRSKKCNHDLDFEYSH